MVRRLQERAGRRKVEEGKREEVWVGRQRQEVRLRAVAEAALG